jgi:hypothetical protein
LKQGSQEDSAELERDGDGRLRFAWKRDTPAVVGKLRQKLIQNNELSKDEGLIHLQDADTGKQVTAHGGSVYFNEYRQRWIAIILESFGSSLLGEIWYAEADTPLGPWVYARKVATHEKYSFYNPKQHPMFDKNGGRTIFFEGTYTNMFSGNPDQTPRYNYNQIMYRLDLDDSRLVLPVAVYNRTVYERTAGAAEGSRRYTTGNGLSPKDRRGPIGWFALDRESGESVPVFASQSAEENDALVIGSSAERPGDSEQPLFHALPVDMPDPPETTVPLYEFVSDDSKRRTYSTQKRLDVLGYRRLEKPVCLVWPSPMK